MVSQGTRRTGALLCLFLLQILQHGACQLFGDVSCISSKCLSTYLCYISTFSTTLPYSLTSTDRSVGALQYCECLDTVEGQLCELEDPCEENICLNGGTCIQYESAETVLDSASSLVTELMTEQFCDCPDGFEGDLCEEGPGVVGDPHMIGFHGQKIDWKGEDGGWYNIMFDTVADIQMNVRLTAPLAEDFPERQLITGFALKYDDDHSVVIETKKPKTTETEGCPDDSVTCIGENALRLTIDGEEHPAIPAERAPLTEDSFMTASNLPAECQPYGGDIVWARTFAKMKKRRLRADAIGLDEWVLGWSASTAAPSWCDKFVSEAGISGLIEHRSKHTAFNIVTPSLALRLHHGTNHQGGEMLEDGRVLPELEFWQMDVHIEWLDVNPESVTGILGETMRPVLDETGAPSLTGAEAMRGNVEDFRVSGPLMSDFSGVHN